MALWFVPHFEHSLLQTEQNRAYGSVTGLELHFGQVIICFYSVTNVFCETVFYCRNRSPTLAEVFYWRKTKIVGLNREEGEFLEGLGRGRVVPTAKWARFLDVASDLARKHFETAGAPSGLKFSPDQILAQEFVLHSKIVFTFCVQISSIEHFYNYTLDLSREAVAELALSGQWPAVYSDLPGIRVH